MGRKIQTQPRVGEFCGACGHEYGKEVTTWPKECDRCGHITYKNPAPAVMVVQPVSLPKSRNPGILFVKRGIEPGYGQWALPGGFMDFGETWQEAGARETMEETGIQIDPSDLEILDLDHSKDRGVVLLFARSREVLKLEDLPSMVPNEEVLEWKVLTGSCPELEDLAFDTHFKMAMKFWNRGL